MLLPAPLPPLGTLATAAPAGSGAKGGKAAKAAAAAANAAKAAAVAAAEAPASAGGGAPQKAQQHLPGKGIVDGEMPDEAALRRSTFLSALSPGAAKQYAELLGGKALAAAK